MLRGHWVQNIVADVYSTWAKWQVAFLRDLSWTLFDIWYCYQWPAWGHNASHHIWGWHQIGGAVNSCEGRPAVQRDLDKPEKWACRRIMKFDREMQSCAPVKKACSAWWKRQLWRDLIVVLQYLQGHKEDKARFFTEWSKMKSVEVQMDIKKKLKEFSCRGCVVFIHGGFQDFFQD